jgi:hypothetical protein
MRVTPRVYAWLVILLGVLALGAWIGALRGDTWLELTDAGTGRTIISRDLHEGEAVVLTWRNSLFGLMVTEVFVARGGILELARISFADPAAAGEPPLVRPRDVEDLYQTGGPFRVEGLSKPVRRVIFRVGEIGNPAIKIGSERIYLAQQVGFGGGVLLEAREANLYQRTVGRLFY